MSEFINNISLRRKELYNFSAGIINGGKRKIFIEKFQNAINNLTPADVVYVVHELIAEQFSVEKVKTHIGKILNIFYEPLKNYNRILPEKNTFLYYLEQENRVAEKILSEIKALLKTLNKKETDFKNIKNKLLKLFSEFSEFEKHYRKKENILFPYIEKKDNKYNCLKVMWSFHDEIRETLKEIISLIKNDNFNLREFNKQTGKFFFAVVPIIFREEYILHPFTLEILDDNDFNEMLIQSFEIGFAYIETPERPKNNISNEELKKNDLKTEEMFVNLKTGKLLPEQIILLINNLPVDITFVDENDVVKFFSNPKHRFFTRSKAIIGRTVQNCHPHESVHIVEEILQSFKNKEKDKARFWIQMKGRFILIEYYALYDDSGNYKGTIEVSQDITDIKMLEGEQRLLDWNKSK